MPFTPLVAAHAGTEHLLPGLLAQQTRLAALALAELGLDQQPWKPTLPVSPPRAVPVLYDTFVL
jgi:hypothetical protein